MKTFLLCTVGTSLLGNLDRLSASGAELDPARAELTRARAAGDPQALAQAMLALPPDSRELGAEVNSVQQLLTDGLVVPNPGLALLHSDTAEGCLLGQVLARYFTARGLCPVQAHQVTGLQDEDPKQFRTAGLRALAKTACGLIREYGAPQCAINATGGYKAQIAMAVLIGQAVEVPVYYLHERFSHIIAFPPMPFSLDYTAWMQASGLLYTLEGETEPVPQHRFQDHWQELWETLVNRVPIDGQDHLELSPVGLVFHEAFKGRFASGRDQVLPPETIDKRPPRWEVSGNMRSRPGIMAFMQRVTDEAPFVVHCATHYFNPDLPKANIFQLSAKGLEGVWSDGSATAKFRVETTATTEGQRLAAAAWLNRWLRS